MFNVCNYVQRITSCSSVTKKNGCTGMPGHGTCAKRYITRFTLGNNASLSLLQRHYNRKPERLQDSFFRCEHIL